MDRLRNFTVDVPGIQVPPGTGTRSQRPFHGTNPGPGPDRVPAEDPAEEGGGQAGGYDGPPAPGLGGGRGLGGREREEETSSDSRKVKLSWKRPLSQTASWG